MNDIEWIDRRPGLGARLTIALLRATRAKAPLDVNDPQALLAARAKLDRFDALTARLHRRSALPFQACEAWLGGVAVQDLTIRAPQAPVSDNVLFFIHGGGFFFRSLQGHMLLAARIAQATGIGRVVLPLYRLAPEHRFPAGQDDCFDAYQALIASGVSPDKIVIAADSAGAALALGMLVGARQRAVPLPKAVALMSPMIDLTYSGASIATNNLADPMLGGAPMPAPSYYVGAVDPGDPRCSPLFADLSGLPPMFIQSGSTERLLDDSIRLTQNGREAGIGISLQIWRDMPHVFQAYDFREARDARASIAVFLRTGSRSPCQG